MKCKTIFYQQAKVRILIFVEVWVHYLFLKGWHIEATAFFRCFWAPYQVPKTNPKLAPCTCLSYGHDNLSLSVLLIKEVPCFQSLQSRSFEARRGLAEATPRTQNVLAQGQSETYGDLKSQQVELEVVGNCVFVFWLVCCVCLCVVLFCLLLCFCNGIVTAVDYVQVPYQFTFVAPHRQAAICMHYFCDRLSECPSDSNRLPVSCQTRRVPAFFFPPVWPMSLSGSALTWE